MLLVSIMEHSVSEPKNYFTVNNLDELYRGLCAGLDVQKFLSMSNYNLFFCQIKFSFQELIENESLDFSAFNPEVNNLADSVYLYMSENLNLYFDIVKAIDEYREKINNYKLDK